MGNKIDICHDMACVILNESGMELAKIIRKEVTFKQGRYLFVSWHDDYGDVLLTLKRGTYSKCHY